jgi:hypothetical protein
MKTNSLYHSDPENTSCQLSNIQHYAENDYNEPHQEDEDQNDEEHKDPETIEEPETFSDDGYKID